MSIKGIESLNETVKLRESRKMSEWQMKKEGTKEHKGDRQELVGGNWRGTAGQDDRFREWSSVYCALFRFNFVVLCVLCG